MIPARGTVEIPGWRRGESKVAAFTFTNYESSYAFKTGRPSDIGAIRLTAYEERSYIPTQVPVPKRSAVWEDEELADPLHQHANRKRLEANVRAGANAAKPKYQDRRLGTGYGRELDHRVDYVEFERGYRTHSINIHYGRKTPVARPYPDDFTPPPPGYRPQRGQFSVR